MVNDKNRFIVGLNVTRDNLKALKSKYFESLQKGKIYRHRIFHWIWFDQTRKFSNMPAEWYLHMAHVKHLQPVFWFVYPGHPTHLHFPPRFGVEKKS